MCVMFLFFEGKNLQQKEALCSIFPSTIIQYIYIWVLWIVMGSDFFILMLIQIRIQIHLPSFTYVEKPEIYFDFYLK